MGTILTPGSTVEQILKSKSKLIRLRFAESDQSLGEVAVRKFSSRLEPDAFLKEGKNTPFDKARFNLVMSNGREEWGIAIDLIFHSRKRLLSDGSMVEAGIQFNVITEEGKGLLIEYFSIDSTEELEPLSAEEWATYWFKKLARSPKINAIFAHKEFIRELEH